MVVVVSSLLLSSSFVVVELSHNESMMPKFWCESEKGKFLMIVDFLFQAVCESKTLMS